MPAVSRCLSAPWFRSHEAPAGSRAGFEGRAAPSGGLGAAKLSARRLGIADERLFDLREGKSRHVHENFESVPEAFIPHVSGQSLFISGG